MGLEQMLLDQRFSLTDLQQTGQQVVRQHGLLDAQLTHCKAWARPQRPIDPCRILRTVDPHLRALEVGIEIADRLQIR